MELAFFIGFVILTVILDVGATIRIRNDEYLKAFQRKALTSFIWLVPIFGALFVYYFRNDDDALLSRRKDDGLSGYQVVDPEMPSQHDDASPGHGHD